MIFNVQPGLRTIALIYLPTIVFTYPIPYPSTYVSMHTYPPHTTDHIHAHTHQTHIYQTHITRAHTHMHTHTKHMTRACTHHMQTYTIT